MSTAHTSLSRRAFLALASVAGATTLAGCATGGTGSASNASRQATETTQNAEVVPPVVAESGWAVEPDQYEFKSQGIIRYAVCLQNPNSHVELSCPAVTIRGLDAEGGELFSQTDHIMFLRPGESGVIAGSAGRGISTEPATVEFVVDEENFGYIASTNAADGNYDFGEVQEDRSSDIGMRYLYDTTIQAHESWDDVGVARVCLVMRDAEGAMVCGYQGTAATPSTDEPQDYHLTIETNTPSFESVEFHAVPDTDANGTYPTALVAH